MSAIVQMLAADPKIDPVAELQKKFALLKLGGKFSVIERPPLGVSWGAYGIPQMFAKSEASTLIRRQLS